jgi:hypothetical protein
MREHRAPSSIMAHHPSLTHAEYERRNTPRRGQTLDVRRQPAEDACIASEDAHTPNSSASLVGRSSGA